MTEKPTYVKLKNRGLIHIEGKDRKDFLQGLITNDINKLSPQTPIYACLLSAQGKFLHDFIVIEDGDLIFLDCEGGERAQDLARRLSMYKLRADVKIKTESEKAVYAIFDGAIGLQDPRHAEMGHRTFEKPNIEERPFEDWDYRRISLTIPDGSRDLIIDKSTMDEGNMDRINAIDYEKGCYIGQELTARMHYRGLGKRKLQTMEISNLPDKADLRSSCNGIGIALVKVT